MADRLSKGSVIVGVLSVAALAISMIGAGACTSLGAAEDVDRLPHQHHYMTRPCLYGESSGLEHLDRFDAAAQHVTAALPIGFEICRKWSQGPEYDFEVMRFRSRYLEILVGPTPYGGAPDNQHIQLKGRDGVITTSDGGKVERLVVTIAGRQRVREVMTESSRLSSGHKVYVVVRVIPDVGDIQAGLAEQLVTQVRVL